MKKEIKKIVATFECGKNNVLMVSERRSGENESDHKERIEERKKVIIEKLNKSNQDTPEKILFDGIITAINKWREECIAHDIRPVCISHFAPFGPELSPTTRYSIFGEQQEVINLLKYTNEMLDPDGGENSLIK